MKIRMYRLTITFFAAFTAFFILPVIAMAQAPLEDTGVGDAATDPINVQYWAIVTGFVLPPIISFILKSQWSVQVQSLVAFGVALVATVVQLFLYGQLDNFVDPAGTFLLVLVSTIAFYKGFWKPTGVSPAIEQNAGLR